MSFRLALTDEARFSRVADVARATPLAPKAPTVKRFGKLASSTLSARIAAIAAKG